MSSDFMVDMLEDWWQRSKERFAGITELVLDLDNGPENGGYRSQFLYRLVGFAREQRLRLELVYYPPYHSKYNPVERGGCWRTTGVGSCSTARRRCWAMRPG